MGSAESVCRLMIKLASDLLALTKASTVDEAQTLFNLALHSVSSHPSQKRGMKALGFMEVPAADQIAFSVGKA